jgi:Tol biopolymer transport system component
MKQNAWLRSNGLSCASVLFASALAASPLGAQGTRIVSVSTSGHIANGDSYATGISADGRYVAFWSYAGNLTPGYFHTWGDAYIHDCLTGLTQRLSIDSDGHPANHGSDVGNFCLSADGRFITFESDATNLVPGDTNGSADAFVHDRLTGRTTRVSVDSGGAQANGDSLVPSISADGRIIAFLSDATNLVANDNNYKRDVFVHDRISGATTRVSVASDGSEADGDSYEAYLSGDGRFVVFTSYARNLIPGDNNGTGDVFVHDRATGETTRVSVSSDGVEGNGASGAPSISADGRYVAFCSDANNLVPGDTNNQFDVFVHDRLMGRTTRVSVDSRGQEANGPSFHSSISADGRFVAFDSYATSLAPGGDTSDNVYVHDRLTGETTLLSVDTDGVPLVGESAQPFLSSDGRYVAFQSVVAAKDETFRRDRGVLAPAVLCLGDGSVVPCPCGNSGLPGHGCENSGSTGGAILAANGEASLAHDNLQLTTAGELPTALSVVVQGSSAIPPTTFGDGLRCAGGVIKRLYVEQAAAGAIVVPGPGELSISEQSAALGAALQLGDTRIYQVYYRDPDFSFCGGGFNAANAIALTWGF